MRFVTTIQGHGALNATGIVVPEEVVAALGSRRAKVVVTLRDYTYRSTLGTMGGQVLVPLSQDHRAKAGVAAGDTVEVDILPDVAPREVEVPGDLAEALEAAGLRGAFDALAFSHRKEHVRAILEAKAADTRARRVAKAVEMIRAKQG